jgi:hypothetical protein
VIPGLTKSKKQAGAPAGSDGDAPSDKKARDLPKPGLADKLAGEEKEFIANLSPYLPHDLIGGSVPHVPAHEDDSVWNAAAQACGTERVHFVYSVEDGRCWYLACPSSSLASNPDSWCPLAAALPGNSEYWDRETVYLYEQEGLASALRWDPETGRMQVFLGAARTLLPRVQSMDANFVTIDPNVADVKPWKNRQLHKEKLSRATARVLLMIGLLVNLVCVAVIGGEYLMVNMVERDLDTAKRQADKAAQDLMINAYNALQSDTIKHMVRIQELLDDLGKLDGTLVRYEVDKNGAEWEALVPSSFGSNCYGALAGCKVEPGLEPDGRVRIKGTN